MSRSFTRSAGVSRKCCVAPNSKFYCGCPSSRCARTGRRAPAHACARCDTPRARMRLSRSGVLARTGVRQGFVIGEPAEVLDRFVQLLVVERAAETFLARGLRDAQRDDAADVEDVLHQLGLRPRVAFDGLQHARQRLGLHRPGAHQGREKTRADYRICRQPCSGCSLCSKTV